MWWHQFNHYGSSYENVLSMEYSLIILANIILTCVMSLEKVKSKVVY